ncbi:MAG: DUF938 domain-containing protein [Acaryochloris sp. RU_4_1]|nr:DUF938 domain-containing protein [Acaryochloris sp. RU_4_1]NJR53798.1 DUF938 domain-containing protein [Acaryochloris sp. CRU_2_0]
MTIPDQRHYAPAVERNRCPILEVLEEYLPSKGIVLEIAALLNEGMNQAGTGTSQNFR